MLVYSTSAAARIANVSPSTVRNLTTGTYAPLYAGLFSAGVRPPTGQPRVYTEGDVRLLAYVRTQTAQGVSHADIAARIAAGALDEFNWSPPEEVPAQPPRTDQPEAPEPSAALLLVREIADQLAGVITSQLVEAREENQRLQAALDEARKIDCGPR